MATFQAGNFIERNTNPRGRYSKKNTKNREETGGENGGNETVQEICGKR